MYDVFDFADDLGPNKILHIYNPTVKLKAIVAVDNVACGPAIGGVRMAPDASTEEAFRLARAMTLKNAAAGLPHGGGKSVIMSDPKMPIAEKERLIRAFAGAIGGITDYIPAARPDVLRADNVNRLKTKLIVSGANIPATAEAEQLLHDRKVLMIPDFIANAGGVICAAVEYHGGTQTTAFHIIEDKIRTNTAAVLAEAARTHGLPRQAAVALAERRVRAAMSYRRW
jgi:glutamate dehydrogenase/leucine dehydrogenase